MYKRQGQGRAQGVQEQDGVAAVHDPVVERHAQVHHLPHGEAARAVRDDILLRRGERQRAGVSGEDDGHRQHHTRLVVQRHDDVGALEIALAQVTAHRAHPERHEVAGYVRQAARRGVPDDGDDQSLADVEGDPHVRRRRQPYGARVDGGGEEHRESPVERPHRRDQQLGEADQRAQAPGERAAGRERRADVDLHDGVRGRDGPVRQLHDRRGALLRARQRDVGGLPRFPAHLGDRRLRRFRYGPDGGPGGVYCRAG